MTTPVPDGVPDEMVEEITAALIEARKYGQVDGINALRNLRSRLELADPPRVAIAVASPYEVFAAGFAAGIQAARAEAATVHANLVRSINA